MEWVNSFLDVFQGSSLCMEDYDGRTPLHIASCEGHLKVVQYLLGHGATVYAKDRYGDTPLRNAIRFRWYWCVFVFLSVWLEPMQVEG